jgi:hypothetical protein
MVEEHKYDDVYLKFDGEKIWPPEKKQQPVFMDSETELGVNIPGLKEGDKVKIELWDWDLLSPDDLLGTFEMVIAYGGPYTTDMTRNLRETKKAKYTLEWNVE